MKPPNKIIMFLITFHSYGRQGENYSGPVGVCSSLERAREYVKEFLREESDAEEPFDETLRRYLFPGTPETDEMARRYSIGNGLKEIESYALDAKDHYSYDYESPMFTIWELVPDA